MKASERLEKIIMFKRKKERYRKTAEMREIVGD